MWSTARSASEISANMCSTITSADADWTDLQVYLPLDSDLSDDSANGLSVSAVDDADVISY